MEKLALIASKSVRSSHDLGCYALSQSSATPFAPKRWLAAAVVVQAHDVEEYITAVYNLSSKG